ncbi:MAG: Gfo/Idh/MocA family oxidoreductase [Planctomycetes bacterium]|nr:Gfo/Idh/MocA family oxidoreductase [Planctomycetota bacterium]
MIRVGLVGLGFIGWIHWLAYHKLGGVRIAAICETDKRRLTGDLRGLQGNFGPPGEQIDLAGISAYANLDDLLGDPQVDLVDIALPTSLHADMAIRALEAGKHVFCEKPMALRLTDCERMVDAARKANRLLVIGHVLPFFPEYDWALKTIRGGEYGAVRGGAFRRVIADPTWLKDFWSADRIGGPMLDLHVHDAHFIRLVFGMPQEVVTCGRMRDGLPEFWHSQFRFADRGLTVEATSGAIDQQGRPFTHAFEIHLERATLMFDFAVIGGEGRYLCGPTLLDDQGGVQRAQLAGGDPIDAFANELREVVRCVRDGQASEILGAILAQDAMRICESQSESLQRGTSVKV